jgi:hypothetical protein
MNRLLKLKLETLKEFQEKYPTSHVGGSIGLHLRGIDLKRDLNESDLDITIDDFVMENDNFVMENESINEYVLRSDGNDFDYAIKKNVGDGSYVKMDIRVCPEPTFDVIEYEGVSYNVSRYRDIIFWKTKYANKDILKHKNDLETIKTGVRPLETSRPNYIVDDLPF